MKKLLGTTLLFSAITFGAAHAQRASPVDDKANPTFMIGIAIDFGADVDEADVGLTAKILSSDRPDTFVFVGGLSYYPWSKDQFGLDLSAGYNLDNFGASAGYDFLRWKPQISAGYIRTNNGKHCADGSQIIGEYCQGIPSDRRLKRDIKLLATLIDGMKIYSFKYLWSEQTYIGVMAQDLLDDPRWAQAVVIGDNGFYAVNYQRLHLLMVTLAAWEHYGISAVVTGWRKAEIGDQLPSLAA